MTLTLPYRGGFAGSPTVEPDCRTITRRPILPAKLATEYIGARRVRRLPRSNFRHLGTLIQTFDGNEIEPQLLSAVDEAVQVRLVPHHPGYDREA